MMFTHWLARLRNSERKRRPVQARYFRGQIDTLGERAMLAVSPAFSPLGTTFALDQQDLYVPLTPGAGSAVTYQLGTHSQAGFQAEVIQTGPTLDFDVSGNGFSHGHFRVQLLPFVAPETVAHFQQLVTAGTFTAQSFYRVITSQSNQGNFLLAQGGTNGAGAGGNIDDEFNQQLAFNSPGLIAMARQTPNDTASSEFFLTDPSVSQATSGDTTLERSLNFKYTPFGQIVSGFDVFQKIMTTAVQTNPGSGEKSQPVTAVTIHSVTQVTDAENAVLHVLRGGTGAAVDKFTVTASDGTGSTQTLQFTINAANPTFNNPPFLGAVPPTLTTTVGAPVNFNLAAVNTSNLPLTYIVTNPSSFGAAPLNVGVQINQATGDVTLTPAAGFSGVVDLLAGVSGASNPTARTQFDTQALRLFVNAGTLSPPNLADGTVGGPLTRTITLADGAGAASVAASQIVGAIPGLSITAGVGSLTIAGTPTSTGTETFLVTGTNAAGGKTTAVYSLTVNPAIGLAPNAAAAGQAGKFYTQTISTSGGTGAILLSVGAVQGAIAGLTLPSAGTGSLTITGTPTAVGTVSFTVTATDAAGAAVSRQYSIAVATANPNAPTTLQLDPVDAQNGNYTTGDAPRFHAVAPAGSQVTFHVNGQNVLATEGAIGGNFSANIPRRLLHVGENVVTATTTDPVGNTSDPSTGFTVIFAPSFQYSYTMPGTPGIDVQRTIHYQRNAAFGNELGFFEVDDEQGTINGIAPGQPGYAAAALSDASKQILVPSNTPGAMAGTMTAQGGALLGFYLVQNSSSAAFLTRNPGNQIGHGPVAFFSFDAANPDGIRHVRTVGDASTGAVQYSFEDLLGGGDRDYNDAVVTIVDLGTSAAEASLAILRAPGSTGGAVVQAVFTLQSQRTLAAVPKGEFGAYFVDDDLGSIHGVKPGDAGYAAAAIARAHRLFLLQTAVGTQQALALPAGQRYGFYSILNGTAAEFTANNPTNDPTKTPTAIFSPDAANPGGKNLFRWFAQEFDGQNLPNPGAADQRLLHVLPPSGTGGDWFSVDVRM